MKYIQKSVNANGLKQIKQFLAENHKKGGDYFSDYNIRAWAADAEYQAREGNPASIEISAFDSISGHTEILTISDNGIDCEEIDIEEVDEDEIGAGRQFIDVPVCAFCECAFCEHDPHACEDVGICAITRKGLEE